MRSGELPAYLSLNCLCNGVISCSLCHFVQTQSISWEFNLCVTDRPTDGGMEGCTDGRMDGRTDGWKDGWMNGHTL